MNSFLTNIRLQSLVLFAVAFLLYINTLGHGFVMDDRVVITENKWTQQGLSGIPRLLSEETFAGFFANENAEISLTGGRYRPLSPVFFAVLVQFFGNSSQVFHFFTVLLYALGCLLLYRFLLLALKTDRHQANAALIAFITTALFATHPVHTEVVANVKGCDELLAFLTGTGALYGMLRAYDSHRWGWSVATGLLFLLSCLAKENAITLLIIAPLTLWFFRDASPLVVFRHTWPLLAAFACYLLARGIALDWQFTGQMMHDPLNNPFLKSDGQQWVAFTAEEKTATILYTLIEYMRLLVWPWPLTHDYYPFQIAAQTFSQPVVLISAVLQLSLLGLVFWGLRQKKITAFGMLFYAITLSISANIFVPIGVFMAERFLFLPSLGFCLVIAALIAPQLQRGKILRISGISGVAALAVIWGILTFLRTPAWKSEERLLETDVVTSPNSAKLRNLLGTAILSKALNTSDPSERLALLRQAETHLETAVELHPAYFDAFLAYGACVFYLQKYDLSIQSYRAATRMNPQDPKAKLGLAYALRYGGDHAAQTGEDPAKAVNYLTEAWQLNPDTAIATHLAQQYLLLKQPRESVMWLEQALSLAPNDPRLLEMVKKARTNTPAKIVEPAMPFGTFQPETGNK